MAGSGVSSSGSVFYSAGSSLSACAPDGAPSVGMYAHATQYRFPRATSNISIGTYYLGKTFYSLLSTGVQLSGYTNSTSATIYIQYGWGAYTNTYAITSASPYTSTPVYSDGYSIFQDTAYSTTLTCSYTSAPYGGSWIGWYSGPYGAGGSLITSATSVSMAGNTSYNTAIATWQTTPPI